MGRYRLLFKKSVAKDLRAIPKKDVQRILEGIKALAEDPRPRGCEKLADQQRYRIRQGPHRIVYKIQDDVLVVIKVQHRSEVYR